MAIELEDLCTTVQQQLSQLAGDNYPAMRREQTGFLDAVVSDTNRAGFSTRYLHDDEEGKLMQVVREWAVPIPYSEAKDTEQSVCESGIEEPRILDVVTLNGYTGSRVIEFTESELRKYCESPGEVQTMRIAQHIGGVMRKLNQKLIAKYLTDVGEFIGGVAPGKNIKLLYDNGITEAAVADGEVIMMEDMADLGVSRPIVVGAGVISRYSRLAEIGCCNDYGQSVDELATSYLFYRDRDVKIVADGTPVEPIICFAPGAVQLSTYNKYRGPFRRVVDNLYAHDTMVDPVTGITLDMKWKYNDCAEKWRLQFGLHHELHLLPELFKAADERFNVNYAFLYNGVVGAPESV